jgi:hypothetical protein
MSQNEEKTSNEKKETSGIWALLFFAVIFAGKTSNEKKETSGIWALLFFAVIFAGAIILGWLCR